MSSSAYSILPKSNYPNRAVTSLYSAPVFLSAPRATITSTFHFFFLMQLPTAVYCRKQRTLALTLQILLLKCPPPELSTLCYPEVDWNRAKSLDVPSAISFMYNSGKFLPILLCILGQDQTRCNSRGGQHPFSNYFEW